MDVLIKFGRHQGEVRDIAPEAALAMLADGRASRPGEVEILESRAFAPEEIAPFVAAKPEEVIEVQPRRRSRR